MSHSPELRVALLAAEAAAMVIRRYYGQPIDVRTKADQSPVTEADVAAERAVRTVLAEHFPNYGFYGEETGQHGSRDCLWLVDPIDGTKAFVRGYPMFSTQIALWRDGRFQLGVSSAPLYGELAYAERGHGAWLNDRPIQMSSVSRIEEAALSSGNLKTLAASPQWADYGKLVARVSRIRGYGDFLHYHLLAAGKIDAVIESDVNILDIAALVTLVEEAGGTFTSLRGAAIDFASTSVLAANPTLHRQIASCLPWDDSPSDR